MRSRTTAEDSGTRRASVRRLARGARIGAAALCLAVACTATAQNDDAGQTLREESAEALTALQNYTAEQKDNALRTAKSLMSRLDERIDDARKNLSRQWDQLDESTRDERQAVIDELVRQRNELKESYERLEDRTGSAWEQVKEGFVDGYRTLTESVDDE